jgi:NCAIR mutase (PurE)-related protein
MTGELLKGDGPVLITRADRKTSVAVKRKYPAAVYSEAARLIVVRAHPAPFAETSAKKYIAVVTAGTSDIPVAEEAALSAEAMGCRVERIFDVGVAGIHRLLEHKDVLSRATCVVVCAGMEGALASVLGGLVRCPVWVSRHP